MDWNKKLLTVGGIEITVMHVLIVVVLVFAYMQFTKGSAEGE